MIAADTILSVHESSARSDAAYALSVDIPSVASEAGESPRKWRPAPGELVSLWDMLRVYAETFVLLIKSFSQLEPGLNNLVQKLDWRSAPSVETKAQADEVCNAIRRFLDEVEKRCAELELETGLDQVQRLRGMLDSDSLAEHLRTGMKELENRIEDELKRRAFFFVSPGRTSYFEEASQLFGVEVCDRFPDAIPNIEDSGWCLGVNRPTAAVYHLMCVMESGIRRLANGLKVKKRDVEHKPWGDIFRVLDRKVGELPYSNGREKARKDKYNEALALLKNVKFAWRNPTMHSRYRFNPTEAEDIFRTVKSFMHFLAAKRF